MVKFVVLSENRANGKFCGESGLSIVVDDGKEKILFDTGYSDLFAKNAKLLDINLDEVKLVILSHGHSDHTNGLPYLSAGKTIVMHPSGFKDRWSNRKKEYVAPPVSQEQLAEKHNLILSSDPIEVATNIIFLGEIPMVVPHEMGGNLSTSLDEELTIPDPTEDDSGIAMKTEEGLFVMTGCGHRGICNTIEHAIKVTGEKKVHAVLGGFHFRKLDKQKDMIDETIKYFKTLGVKHLYLGHCNSDPVIDYMEQKLPNVQIHRLASGKEFNLESQQKIKI